MNAVSLYAAKHTDAAHISEFFSKKLLAEGEEALAVFDGVFYEAKNERVGGVAFHDYLIFSSKSIYIWARGINKDYLDRFPLGSVSFKSKVKDRDFSVLDISITREGKPPIVLIFDLIPTPETEMLIRLHYELESALESYYGGVHLTEISDEAALNLISSAKEILPQREIPIFAATETDDAGFPFFPFSNPLTPHNPSSPKIYGDTLLERLRYMRSAGVDPKPTGQTPPDPFAEAQQGRNPFQQFYSPGAHAMGNLDMVSLKRAEAITKDLLNNIPEEYRNQAKEDLEKLPERFSTTLSTLNEIVKNVAQNPEAQNFIIQTVATAVKNDGILGAFVKAMTTYQNLPNSRSNGNPQSNHANAEFDSTNSGQNQTPREAEERNDMNEAKENQDAKEAYVKAHKRIKINID
ncbi:MAG: hypothetical protein SFU91_02405 [Chloroherpetonaceae bacterium]|nr:hypothetical protein [Chloroherpetonaceae bacterium]